MKSLLNWLRFFFSKTFWKHIALMILLTFFMAGGIYFYLLNYTRHGEKLEVPDLYGKKIKEAEKILQDNHMKLVVVDTLAYNPDLPKFAVLEQNPKAGSGVKQGRKIYVKINAGGYRKVTLPKLRGLTLRQARSTLQAMGIVVGKVEEKPYFAEVVLEILKGKDTLRSGDQLYKNSVVKLIVGSGEEEFEIDTLTQGQTVNDSVNIDLSPEEFSPFN